MFPQFLETSGKFWFQDSKKKQQTMLSAATCTAPALKSATFGCWGQRSKGQRQRRYRWPKSTEKEQKTHPFGQYTAEFETGNLEQKRLSRGKRSTDLSPYSIMLFCFLILFTSTLDITIASHNLHSFKQSVAYHRSCLQTYGGIWFAQELWLSENQLPMLQQLGTQFVARSGMEHAVSDGLLVGRPFGGVSISWSPNLNHLISPLTNFSHKRIVGLELKSGSKDILLICIYMPFYNSARRAECMAECIDAIEMLDTIIEQHPNHQVIIGGDYNTELKGYSPLNITSTWQNIGRNVIVTQRISLW